MSQHRSRPSNDIGFYYDELVRAAARHIDERPWLQTIDVEDQRSIFVGVCMAIHRYYRSDVPSLTLRSRLLHAYAQSGLVQLFPSRTSENERIRTARRPRDRRDAHVRARSAPAVAQHAPAGVEAVRASTMYPAYVWPGTFLTNVESRRRARQVHLICLPEAVKSVPDRSIGAWHGLF